MRTRSAQGDAPRSRQRPGMRPDHLVLAGSMEQLGRRWPWTVCLAATTTYTAQAIETETGMTDRKRDRGGARPRCHRNTTICPGETLCSRLNRGRGLVRTGRLEHLGHLIRTPAAPDCTLRPSSPTERQLCVGNRSRRGGLPSPGAVANCPMPPHLCHRPCRWAGRRAQASPATPWIWLWSPTPLEKLR